MPIVLEVFFLPVCDPHISRIASLGWIFCPKFLDLYASIYGKSQLFRYSMSPIQLKIISSPCFEFECWFNNFNAGRDRRDHRAVYSDHLNVGHDLHHHLARGQHRAPPHVRPPWPQVPRQRPQIHEHHRRRDANHSLRSLQKVGCILTWHWKKSVIVILQKSFIVAF